MVKFKAQRSEEVIEAELVGDFLTSAEMIGEMDDRKGPITMRFVVNLPKRKEVEIVESRKIENSVRSGARDIDISKDYDEEASYKNFDVGNISVGESAGLGHLIVLVDLQESTFPGRIEKLIAGIERSLRNMGFRKQQTLVMADDG